MDTTAVGEAGTPPRSGHIAYFPALDGLRAIAVAAVLLYHAGQAWIPGGFLGVEMFFVISGYLISSLLLVEWESSQRIDLKAFWLRRARRLMPAVLLLLVGTVSWTAYFHPDELSSLRGDVASTVGYVNNWYQILAHKSYFESVGRPSLLRHMWSLAVEEQFYLLWPVAFALLLRGVQRRFILGLVLAGAVVSVVAMAIMFHPNDDPSRVYYGTDTRASGLLLGVALALCWKPGTGAGTSNSFILDTMGFGALACLAACFAVINEFQPLLYRGGFTLVGLVTSELIAVVVSSRTGLLARFLGSPPLRWAGTRSYGIYLWHFPVFMLTRPQLDVPWDGPLWLMVRITLTLLIAEASYRWVESPIRRGALGRAWNDWRRPATERVPWFRKYSLLAGVSIAAVLGVVLTAVMWTAKPPAPPDYLVHRPVPITNLVPVVGSRTNTLAIALPPTSVTNRTPVSPVSAAINGHPEALDVGGVTAIGDSVLEGVADELQRMLGRNLIVDADQGRLPWNAPAIVRQLRAARKIRPVVILHIGNNGFFSADNFKEIMNELHDSRRVVVVNLKVPRNWESLNNAMLASVVKSYPNAVLVDWRTASGSEPRLFWKDGIHVRPEGARVYARLVRQALNGS